MQVRAKAVLAWGYERTTSTYNPCHIRIPIRYENCSTADCTVDCKFVTRNLTFGNMGFEL